MVLEEVTTPPGMLYTWALGYLKRIGRQISTIFVHVVRFSSGRTQLMIGTFDVSIWDELPDFL